MSPQYVRRGNCAKYLGTYSWSSRYRQKVVPWKLASVWLYWPMWLHADKCPVLFSIRPIDESPKKDLGHLYPFHNLWFRATIPERCVAPLLTGTGPVHLKQCKDYDSKKCGSKKHWNLYFCKILDLDRCNPNTGTKCCTCTWSAKRII